MSRASAWVGTSAPRLHGTSGETGAGLQGHAALRVGDAVKSGNLDVPID
jgi:hypothetical protein